MWAVRILNGPQVGQIFNLRSGKNSIGRSSDADIKINSQGISKLHCEIHVLQDKVMITDLKSSNGTYVNGIKIQNSILRLGEKFSLHEVLLDIIPAQQEVRPPVQVAGANALKINNLPQPHIPVQHQAAQPVLQAVESEPVFAEKTNPLDKFKDYLDRAAMPAVYKLAQMFDFKLVIMGFIAAFVLIVTLLSMIPMSQLAKSSILKESQNRASSLARNLATSNKKALVENSGALSTYSAEVEEGVRTVYIIQDSDGMILAPSSKAGRSSDSPFTQRVRKERRALTTQIDSSTLGASAPIDVYDPESGEMKVKAHAIVIYDISSLAFDEGKTISLFMQTLMIASLVGFFLFFFIYKLIEFPIKNLSEQLDLSLREKRAELQMTFQFEPLQNLISNMNSLLTRFIHGSDGGSQQSSSIENKDSEVENLMKMIGAPSLAISSENRVISANLGFEQLARLAPGSLQQGGIDSIPDNSLQQNIEHLIGKARENPYGIHSDYLEFNGPTYVIQCQAFLSGTNNINYFLITVLPQSAGVPR